MSCGWVVAGLAFALGVIAWVSYWLGCRRAQDCLNPNYRATEAPEMKIHSHEDCPFHYCEERAPYTACKTKCKYR